MSEIRGAALNGLAVKSWGDVVAVATLLALFLGTLSWGLKLEQELNTVRNHVFELRGEVDVGVLPRAEERLQYLDRALQQHLLESQRRFSRVEDRLDGSS